MKTSDIQKRINTINRLNTEWWMIDNSSLYSEGARVKKQGLIDTAIKNKQEDLVRLFFYHGLNVKDFDFGNIDSDCFLDEVSELQKKNQREVEELNRLRALNLV